MALQKPAAGAGLGTSPATPTFTGRDRAGTLSCALGTTPPAGPSIIATLELGGFSGYESSDPIVAVIVPMNAAAQALGLTYTISHDTITISSVTGTPSGTLIYAIVVGDSY